MSQNYDIYDGFDPSTHTVFSQQSHPGANTESNNDPAPQPLPCTRLERTQSVKAIIILLLYKSPFPVKYEDIRNVLVQNIGKNYSTTAFKVIIDDVNNTLQKNLGLKLNELKYASKTCNYKDKREFVLSQNFCYQAHNNRVLPPAFHEIRGFILFLIPCLKAYSDVIYLDSLFIYFQQIGKTHMIPTNDEDIKELLATLKLQRRAYNVKHDVKDLKTLSDYLLYARDLLYLTLTIKNDAFDSYISPGPRLIAEHNPRDYVERLKTLLPQEFAKSLDFIQQTQSENIETNSSTS